MTLTRSRQVRLKSRPDGIPQAEHFELVAAPLPELRDGQFLVRNAFLSVDPAMRGWVSVVANYSQPVNIGEVMRSFAAGEVIASRHPGYAVGDKVMGLFGWQEYAVSDGSQVTRKVRETDLPLSASLGILGLNGVTAYLALLDIGQPRAGDTVVVSTAAGAVGATAGQIAKLAGCRTVGIAGGATKKALCRDEFGYDAAIDYKAGELDAALRHLSIGARVVICGTASVSSWAPPPTGPRVERELLVKRARMQGFIVFDYQHRYEEAVSRLADWVRAGKLRYREDILEGIEHAPGAIAGLYRGENLGKRLIRLRHE
jgi:NADPH-dependent curcumin reductase CurA